MYSYEITEYLNKRNYELTPIEFMDVINGSPQIKDVYFQGGDKYDKFKMCTDDGYNWNIRMQKEPKKLTLKKDNN
jgi:hypothetical protein